MEQSQYNGIDKRQKKQTAAFAIWGGIIIAAILLLTTIWVLEKARTGTSQAVSKVSEFYLEELAGRRAQVVSEELKNNFTYIERALSILDESNLESEQTLRWFLGKIKRLYSMDKFALVDENGIIYAEHSTVSGLSRYSFLADGLTEPVINTPELYREKKQVILAAPVEGIYFQGARITACFIQLNIDDMLSSLTLQTNDDDTYCNLYYRNGESLTNDDFGYLTAGKNLLSALGDADMEDGSSYEQFKKDFADGRMGKISFSYEETKEELCYIPVEDTNWMLTILIRDNIITDQISSISSGMMRRGIIQIAITVLGMLMVFLGLIYQSRRGDRAL